MKTQNERQTVIAMHQAGQSIRKISLLLKMSRKTIRRILSGQAADGLSRPSRYEPLTALIIDLYQRLEGNCVLIQSELAERHGERIPYTSLTHLVRSLNLRPEKIRRSGTFTYAPGQEAQHDTSTHRLPIAGKRVKAQCASMVLANSRLLFFQYYPRFTRFEAKAFLTEALDYFGGVPRICVIDNTSVLVAAGSGPDAIIAPEIEAFGAIYGMRFAPHAIGHADRSALVERNFLYIENSFLPGKDFASWQQLNEAARHWCDNVANNKIKRALAMTARQAYQSERPFLQALPAVKPPLFATLSRTVDMYGYVTVNTNRYSVPERLCGKPVEIQKGLYEIVILHRHRAVATHVRILEKRDGKSTIAGHHLQPMARKTDQRSAPLMHQLMGHSQDLDAYVADLIARFPAAATRRLQRLLAIKRSYPKQAFDQAIASAIKYGVFDLGRLEKIILTAIAGDFFELKAHDDTDNR